MKNILFLCTGNSCRSQMAEGFCHDIHAEHLNAYSAGIEAHGINPYAVKVMLEEGIDMSQKESKMLGKLEDINFDFVVTVCDNAAKSCPSQLHDSKVIHHQFDDPPFLAKNANGEAETLVYYRQVRDEIKTWISELPLQL